MSLEFNKQFFLQGNYDKIVSLLQGSSSTQEKFLLIESLIYLGKYDQANNEIDSLETHHTITKKENNIVFLLLKAYYFASINDKDSSTDFLTQADNILQKIKKSTYPLQEESILFLYIKGLIFYNFQLFDKAITIFQLCVEESTLVSNKFYLTRSFNRLAQIYYDQERFDQAQEVTMKALSISTANNYLFEIIQGYDMLGLLNQNKNFNQSLKYFQQCLKLAVNDLHNDVLIAKALMNIGKTKLLQKDLDEAFQHFTESLNLYTKAAYETDKPLIMKNLGDIYVRRGNYSEAIDHYKISLDYNCESASLVHRSQTLFALGSVYFRIREFKNALKYYQESLTLKREIGNPIDLAGPLWGIGHVYFIKQSYSKAIKHYSELYSIYKDFGRSAYVSEILLIIVTLHASIDDKEEMNQYLSILKQLSNEKYSSHTDLSYSIALALSKSDDRMDVFDIKFELFNKIKHNLYINPHYTYFSLLNILLLNIQEYILTLEDVVLEDFRENTNMLRDFSAKNYNYPLELFSNLLLLQMNYIQNQKDENNSLLVKITSIMDQIQIKPIENEMTKILKKIDRLDKKNTTKNVSKPKEELIKTIGLQKFIKRIITDKYWL